MILHLSYKDRVKGSLTFCGFGTHDIPEDHTVVHIGWAGKALLANSHVCSMCYTEWTNAVESLEWRVWDEPGEG